jgi:hypothetical protein
LNETKAEANQTAKTEETAEESTATASDDVKTTTKSPSQLNIESSSLEEAPTNETNTITVAEVKPVPKQASTPSVNQTKDVSE